MTRIAIVLPSRGLVFSKTVEELYRELEGLDFKIFWSHGRPIPDCFEIPTQEALKDPTFTHLLTIEEDMIIPRGSIKAMLKTNKHAVAYDYPVTGDPGGTVLYDDENTAFFTGCGILLVDMDIVRRMPFPIWRVDIQWNMKLRTDRVEFDIQPRQKAAYGQQDIAFGLRLYANRLPIHVMPKPTGQRKLVKRGRGFTNKGYHRIVEYKKVNKQHYFTGKTETSFYKCELPDGSIINLYKDDALKLSGQGKIKLLQINRAEFNGIENLGEWVWLKSS